MKTVEEVAKICWNSRYIADIEKELKQWSLSIIYECADSAKASIETWDEEDPETGNLKQKAIVNRSSILQVKDKL